MSSHEQPDNTAENGVILTVGMVVDIDRCAIVLPVATDNSTLDANTICQDAVAGFIASGGPIDDLVTCLSSDAHITFVQGDGMIDGKVPFRNDFSPTAHPGTRAAGTMPSQVAALIYFYQDELHGFNTRTRVGKNFIPGIPHADAIGDIISNSLFAALQQFSDDLQNGYASVDDASKKWYRYLAAPKTRQASDALKTTFIHGPRNYVCTQRRRLIPR